jgi:hypothetical protein
VLKRGLLLAALLALAIPAATGAAHRPTADCGLIAVPATGSLKLRAWAEGTSCSVARSLLTSDDVARGLPHGAFVPPHIFKAKGFVCGYDLLTLVCWVGHPTTPQLTLKRFRSTADLSGRVVVASPVGVEIVAPTARAAAVKAMHGYALLQGKQTSPTPSGWEGSCRPVKPTEFLPGVAVTGCFVFFRSNKFGGQVFVYRAAPSRWDIVGVVANPVVC